MLGNICTFSKGRFRTIEEKKSKNRRGQTLGLESAVLRSPRSCPEWPSRNERSEVAGRFGLEPVLGGGVPALHQRSGPPFPLPGYQATDHLLPPTVPSVAILGFCSGSADNSFVSLRMPSKPDMVLPVASSDHCFFLPPINVLWVGRRLCVIPQDPFAIWTKTTPIVTLACEGSSSVSRDTARVSIGETRPHSGPIGPTLWYAPAPLLLGVWAVGYSARWVPVGRERGNLAKIVQP